MNNLIETINNDAMNTMQGNAKSDIHQLVIIKLTVFSLLKKNRHFSMFHKGFIGFITKTW